MVGTRPWGMSWIPWVYLGLTMLSDKCTAKLYLRLWVGTTLSTRASLHAFENIFSIAPVVVWLSLSWLGNSHFKAYIRHLPIFIIHGIEDRTNVKLLRFQKNEAFGYNRYYVAINNNSSFGCELSTYRWGLEKTLTSFLRLTRRVVISSLEGIPSLW